MNEGMLRQLAEALATVPAPSTKHMEREEREQSVWQMLADLWRLAKSDGCIAAAWALEILGELAAMTPEEAAKPRPITPEALLESGWRPNEKIEWTFGLTETTWLRLIPVTNLVLLHDGTDDECVDIRRVRDLADLDRLVAAIRGDA